METQVSTDVARSLTALLPLVSRSLAARGAHDADDVASQALTRTWTAYADGRIPAGREVSYLWSAAKSALWNARDQARRERRALANSDEVVQRGMAGAWASSLQRPDDAAHALRVCAQVGMERIQAQIDDAGTDHATRRRLATIVRAVEVCAGF